MTKKDIENTDYTDKTELMKIYNMECKDIKDRVITHIYDYLSGSDKFEEYCEDNNVEDWDRWDSIEDYLGYLNDVEFDDFMYCCGDEEIEWFEDSEKTLSIERTMIDGKRVVKINVE